MRKVINSRIVLTLALAACVTAVSACAAGTDKAQQSTEAKKTTLESTEAQTEIQTKAQTDSSSSAKKTQADGGNEPVAASEGESVESQESSTQGQASQNVDGDGYELRDETVYATEKVNIRAQASTDSDKLGSLEAGDSVKRTGYSEEWSKVEYNGAVCYIASRYLSADKPSENQAQTTTAAQTWSGDISTLSTNEFSGIASYTDRDSKNVPNGCYYLTKLYSKYNAVFIEDTTKNVIYLTMDEGYEAGYTPTILDTLKEKGVTATFFITKEFYDAYPEYVERMIADGHTVGNHTCNHKDMPSLTIEEQEQEIMVLHNKVKEELGYEMKLFRFPEGSTSEQSLALAQSLGYKSVFWSFHYLDYNDDAQKDPAETLQLCMDSIHPGAIYLLHAKSATNTQILGEWIDAVRAAGYEFGGGIPID